MGKARGGCDAAGASQVIAPTDANDELVMKLSSIYLFSGCSSLYLSRNCPLSPDEGRICPACKLLASSLNSAR